MVTNRTMVKKIFYSLSEAATELNVTEEELKHYRSLGAIGSSFASSITNPGTLTTANAHRDILSNTSANTAYNIGGYTTAASGTGAVAYGNATTGEAQLNLKNGVSITLEQAKKVVQEQMPQFFAQGRHQEMYDIFMATGLSSHFVSAL